MADDGHTSDAATGAVDSPAGGSAGAAPVTASAGQDSRPRDESDRAFKAGFAKATERTRREVLSELGLDSEDALSAYRAWKAGEEQKQPAYEKAQRELTRKATEAEKRASEFEKRYREQAEANLALHVSSRVSDIARELSAYDSGDLFEFVHERIDTPDGEDGPLFIDDSAGVRVKLDDKDAWKQIGAHLAKTKPHWFRSPLSSGAGTRSASTRPVPTGNGKQEVTRKDVARALAEQAAANIFGRY